MKESDIGMRMNAVHLVQKWAVTKASRDVLIRDLTAILVDADDERTRHRETEAALQAALRTRRESLAALQQEYDRVLGCAVALYKQFDRLAYPPSEHPDAALSLDGIRNLARDVLRMPGLEAVREAAD